MSGKNNDTLRLDDPGVVDKKPHSLLPSLLILGLLFLLLGAAGFGLWMLLFSAEPSETSSERQPIAVAEDSQNQETAKESGAKNPIERAKETIASVPKLDLDELSGQSESESKVESAPVVESAPEAEITRQVATPEAENKKTNEKTNAMQVDSAAKAMSTPAPRTESTAEMEATKATVSEFLGSLHIGGMRQGARPMILIEGQPHTVGDTVQAETGLKFDGIRDGKLAFIDENDVVYLKSF
ncbi:MAG: hypothetical protein GVY36_00930 [Verrucomicrobia bacterium]|nr:hypothetical protein [Verrucomicrobiota bacterium]